MDVKVMGVSMAAFTTFIEQFSDVLWNSLLLFLLVGTGVYFTVRLRGVQVRRFGEGFRRVFGGFTLRGKKADAEGMSSFQALTTAIAAQVGTGNITGCATALVSGSPLIASAAVIASTVPPVGIAMLPPKATRKRALHWFVNPRKVTMPAPARCTMHGLLLTAVSVRGTFCPAATV